ncbi:MAG: CaiB/BaiF CoA-transferase family protein [Aeromicrobium sp.]
MTGPLAGLRVVEFAGLAPAPFATTLLADHGADVIRVDRTIRTVERPDVMGRSRAAIEVDLKDPDVVEAVLALIDGADVLIEGFRPGVMERLGLGPDVCLARNPGLVYGRMTGWGQTGPLSHAAGHDINYIALTGALHAIGPADRPPTPPVNFVGDFGGGGLMLAFGVLAALTERHRSGRGQVVDAAMVDGAALLTTHLHAMKAQGQFAAPRGENLLDGGAPFYRTYATADGGFVAVGAIEPQFYAALLDGLGLVADDLPPQMDPDSWPALHDLFTGIFRAHDRDHWQQVFDGTDACVSPVLSPDEAATGAHVAARSGFVEVDGIVQPAPAPRFDRTPSDEPSSLRDATPPDLESWGLSPDHAGRLAPLARQEAAR